MRWFRKKSKVPVSSLRIGTDIHTHLLPGVDDGRFTFGSAAETLSQMYDKGIDRVYLTPHMIAGLYENSHEKLHDALKGVKDCVGTATIPEISLGAEYMIDETLLPYIEKSGDDILTVLDCHVLIEMSYYGMSPQLFDVVAVLSEMGYKPILAHPERYLYMDGHMADFDRLHNMGCTFQLNMLSMTGIYGETSIRIMNNLFERSLYRYAGSDIHSQQQFEQIYNSHIDEKIALAGERALLWGINISK